MHLSSWLSVILCAVLFTQNSWCSAKSDDKWWYNLTGVETRQRSQWTTLDSKSTKSPPKLTTPSNSQFRKRSSFGFDDGLTDSPINVRSKSWEKSHARRRDFDQTWRDNQPVRERFSETEWDDDVPVRHVFRDSTSSIDEGPSRSRFGMDDMPRERGMSRPWSRGDWNSNTFSNSKNSKLKTTTSASPQTKSDRAGDRILNLNFQDEDSKRKDKERLDQLAKQIFGEMDTGSNGKTRSSNGVTRSNGNGSGNSFNNGNGRTTVSNGNGFSNGNGRTTVGGVTRSNGYTTNGYVRDAVNSFTRSPGNSYVSTNGNGNDNGFTRTSTNGGNGNGDNQVSSRLVSNNNGAKPKFSMTTTTKADKSTPTLTTPSKPKSNDIRLVADKPKASTTPASQVGFGWRSSINHLKDDKKSEKLQNSVDDSNVSDENVDGNEDAEEDDEFEDDLDDDLDDITTTRPPTTRATTRTTIRPAIRTTQRSTTRSGVEYTTYRVPETTRPQTTPAITTRVVQTTTTTRPRPTTTKSSEFSNDLSPDKKQHRMGSWVDSESLDYVEGEGEDGDDSSDAEAPIPVGVPPDAPQSLVQEEFEEQLPERVEQIPPIAAPLGEEQKFARQSARDEGDDEFGSEDGFGQRLEDALPGVPGTDYPIFATIPRTNFDCRQHEWPGYYADVETQCQVFHICQTGGRKNSFLCPNGTMFNQQIFVCDWWHNVQCGDSQTHYALNENIYDHNWESKRVSAANAEEGSVKRSGALTATNDEDIDGPDSDQESDDSMERRMDRDNGPMDAIDEDYADENISETGGKAQLSQRDRSPIRIYRTARIITDPDRQKRRRRKRGHLKN